MSEDQKPVFCQTDQTRHAGIDKRSDRLLTCDGIYRFVLVGIVLSVSAAVVHVPGILFNVGVRSFDFNAHYAWAVQFTEALRAGDPYPHWMWRGNFGLGEVALLFYSPFFYYICGAVRLLTANTWEAMRTVSVLSTIATGFYGWQLLRLHMGSFLALIGAVLLQWAPMISMIFYYYSGFPWATSFAVLVALTYYVTRPGAFERWVDIPVSISVAVLVLTHIVSALMTLICFSFMCIYFLKHSQQVWRSMRRVVSWFVSASIGLLLSMFYMLPALVELHLVSPEVWTTNFVPWNTFAFPIVTAFVFGMKWFSFQWIVPIIVLLGVIAATWYASAWRDFDYLNSPLILMLVISWAALFFASELSYPLWLLNTPLRLIQFPHRFIYIVSVTGLVANLLAFSELRRAGLIGRRELVIAVPLIIGFVSTGVIITKVSLFDGKPHHLEIDEVRPYAGLPEYQLSIRGLYWRDYYRAGGLVAECAERMLTCRTLEMGSLRQSWSITGARPTQIVLPLFAFPAWQLEIDDRPVPSVADPATGLICINLPAGTHIVVVSWRRLTSEWIGLLITASAALLLIFTVWMRRMELFSQSRFR